MPYIDDIKREQGSWKEKYSFFKGEKTQVNIGLGNGEALNILNSNIKLYSNITRGAQ